MGFLKNISNALSGKTSKHSEYIVNSMIPIFDNIQEYECNERCKSWARTNLSFTTSTLSYLMFPSMHDVNIKKHSVLFVEFTQIERTDSQGVEALIKQLTTFNLILYLSNVPEGDYIDSLDVAKEDFISIISAINNFSVNDTDEFQKLFGEFYRRVDFKLWRIIYENMLNRGFRTTFDNNVAKVLAFADLLVTSHISLFEKY